MSDLDTQLRDVAAALVADAPAAPPLPPEAAVLRFPRRRASRRLAAAVVVAAAAVVVALAVVATIDKDRTRVGVGGRGDEQPSAPPSTCCGSPGGVTNAFPVVGSLPTEIDPANVHAVVGDEFHPRPSVLLGRLTDDGAADLILAQSVRVDELTPTDDSYVGTERATPQTLMRGVIGTLFDDPFRDTTRLEVVIDDIGVVITSRSAQGPILWQVGDAIRAQGDGTIALDVVPDGYVQLGGVGADFGAVRTATLSYFRPARTDSPYLTITTLTPTDPSVALTYSDEIDPLTNIKVHGQPAWIRQGGSRAEEPILTVLWEAQPGLYVRLDSDHLTADQLRQVAASLQFVDQETWTATYDSAVSGGYPTSTTAPAGVIPPADLPDPETTTTTL